jgi:Predicted pyridoxal phosphate-dependent enzyme apparently involved in regulation of cell wall biogenesis
MADLATFSFYPTKNLGALGDGGAVATHHVELAERVRRLSQYGWADKYTSTEPGGRNSRLDELQAAVLRTRLPRVDDGNQRRRDIIARYAAAAPDGLRVLPAEGPNHAGHLCVVETADARALAEHLAGSGSRPPSTTPSRTTVSRRLPAVRCTSRRPNGSPGASCPCRASRS